MCLLKTEYTIVTEVMLCDSRVTFRLPIEKDELALKVYFCKLNAEQVLVALS